MKLLADDMPTIWAQMRPPKLIFGGTARRVRSEPTLATTQPKIDDPPLNQEYSTCWAGSDAPQWSHGVRGGRDHPLNQRGPGVVLQVSGVIPVGRRPEYSGMVSGPAGCKTTRVGRPEWLNTPPGPGIFLNIPDFSRPV